MIKKNVRYKQLCWKCSKSCDKFSCVWVRTLKKRYKGTIVDDDGYIISCPKFIDDGTMLNMKEKAEKLGISLSKYKSTFYYIKKNGYNLSVEEYLKNREEQLKEIEFQKTIDKDYRKKLLNARSYIVKKGLKITPEDYLKQRELKKKEIQSPGYSKKRAREYYLNKINKT